ncbi:hypothetical protein NEHOM01_0907 [Nematocida homosporus]|uniref:uncharacterized protein n=1 Tax=Nematocida homosporus TaxID=1912981 RepID=UPI00221FDB6E|nr:uncharacterized protein NEHOM01_0907 [Nematocida homosporus]KAI5185548.1 hypothetical protein NEHOM01_0907 [Nematocida homosporus]
MDKKYNGLVFSKDANYVPQTQEEQEVFTLLNKRIHNNDLEDDFFEVASGLRDGSSDSDSSIEEVDNEMDDELDCNRSDCDEIDNGRGRIGLSSTALNITSANTNTHTNTNPTSTQTNTNTTQSDLYNFNSLINEVNSISGGHFEMLSSFFDKKRAPKKKKKKVATNIEECNMILNRMGSFASTFIEEEDPKPSKRSKVSKQEEFCGNWDNLESSSTQATRPKYQPNLI